MAKGWPFRYEPCPQLACASGVRSLWQDHISIFVALLPALHLTRLVDIRAQGGVWRAGLVSGPVNCEKPVWDVYFTFTRVLLGARTRLHQTPATWTRKVGTRAVRVLAPCCGHGLCVPWRFGAAPRRQQIRLRRLRARAACRRWRHGRRAAGKRRRRG